MNPATTPAGWEFALSRGAALSHPEQFLVLGSTRRARRVCPGLSTRPAVEPDLTLLGALRLERDGERVGVYGFAVDPAWLGKGIGREVPAASAGFVPEAGEDYWALWPAPPALVLHITNSILR